MDEMPRMLPRIEIASPCRVAWSSMKGDDQVRLCKQCDQHVFNLEHMTVDQISAMLQEKEGRACVRFYRRFDGTILTKDCPIGLAAQMRHQLFKGALWLAGVISLVTFGLITFAATSAVAGGPRPMPEFQRNRCGER